MGQAMDFEKLRVRRRRGILLRRMLVLAVIAGSLFAVLSLNDILINWRFPTRVSDFFQGFGGSGYPIRVPGGILRDVKALGGDIAVLNDTNLYLYNKKGKEMLGVQRMSDSTILLARGGRLLTYNVGGTGFRVHSKSQLLLDGEHENPLVSAALGERGNYALVSPTKQYTSQVTVYDEHFEQNFQWSSNELVAVVALDPRGGGMAAGCLGAWEGELRSAVLLFAFDTENETARLELAGEMILSLEYLAESHIGVLTDRGFRVMDAAGKLINTCDIPGGQLRASRTAGGSTLLLSENPESRSQTAILLSARGEELGRANPESAVRDMQVGSGGVYLLTARGVERYDRGMKRLGTVELGGVNRILLAGNTLYCFTSEEIYVLSEEPRPPSREEQSDL